MQCRQFLPPLCHIRVHHASACVKIPVCSGASGDFKDAASAYHSRRWPVRLRAGPRARAFASSRAGSLQGGTPNNSLGSATSCRPAQAPGAHLPEASRSLTRRGGLPASTSLGLGALRFRPSAFRASVFSQPSGWALRIICATSQWPGVERTTQQTFSRFDSQYGLPALSEFWL